MRHWYRKRVTAAARADGERSQFQMVQFNIQEREVTIKVVYYGPALSGKTTNLLAVHSLVDPEHRGKMITLDTQDDRTIFFDLLPLFFQTANDLSVKIKLFTVPGQVIHDSTRRVVLVGADAVAFIANAQHEKQQENIESFNNLMVNLKLNGFARGDMPIVIQFNKLDLPDAMSPEEVESAKQKSQHPIYPAIALQGKGVIKTLAGLLGLTWASLERKHDLGAKFGLTREVFLGHVFRSLEIEGGGD